MIPLYILGLLQRFGPQHGYQIKKIISDELADFTQIKLPTIYYHLEKMQGDDLLEASFDKPGHRPEKTVYSVTEKGAATFRSKLSAMLEFEYRPGFPADSVFYFSEALKKEDMIEHLETYILRLQKIEAEIVKHKNMTLQVIPEDAKADVRIIFSHHEYHYRAELQWANEALRIYREEK